MVFVQAGNVPDAVAAPPRRAEVLRAQEAARTARRVPADVHVEPDRERVGRGRPDRPEVRLPRVDGPVARLAQVVGQGAGVNGPLDAADGGKAVHVPVREIERGMLPVVGGVLAERPVRHPVPGRVEPRQQAHPRGGTDAARVGPGELHPLRGEPLHVGGAVAPVEGRLLLVKRHRGVLPPHVVHEEEHDVGRVGLGRGGRGSSGGEERKQECEGADRHRREGGPEAPPAAMAQIERGAAPLSLTAFSFGGAKPGSSGNSTATANGRLKPAL